MPAQEIGVSVRDPQKAQELARRGVRVRQGDYNDPASLARAFAGASQVLIISANSMGETAIRLNRTAIACAVEAGARHLFYTSHMGAAPDSLFPAMITHAATETALQESGVPFTSLRNGYYASTTLLLLGNAVQTGELIAPEDGPISWTAHADLAEAAAIAMSKGALDGITPALTGSEALDLRDIAAIAAELAGRPIRRVVVSDDAYLERLVTGGMPEAYAHFMIGIFKASRRGEFSRVDPTLAHLIGHPPTTVAGLLRATLLPAG